MTSGEILNRIRVATPCPANWSDMTGDDQVRFCGQCEKHVYDIHAIPTDEAVSLIQRSEGDLCVRLHRRQDGKLLNGDCPVGVRRVWSRWKRFVGIAAATAVVALSAKLAPSLEAEAPRVSVAAPAAPGPVLLAYRDFTAALKEWLGIGSDPPPMGQMIEMGDICLPEDWQPETTGGVPDRSADPAQASWGVSSTEG